jgi:hypothetical protein
MFRNVLVSDRGDRCFLASEHAVLFKNLISVSCR